MNKRALIVGFLIYIAFYLLEWGINYIPREYVTELFSYKEWRGIVLGRDVLRNILAGFFAGWLAGNKGLLHGAVVGIASPIILLVGLGSVITLLSIGSANESESFFHMYFKNLSVIEFSAGMFITVSICAVAGGAGELKKKTRI